MSSEMTVDFPGGKKVTAHYDDFEMATDQGVDSGGEGTAPEPFDFFLASLATCAGYYVLKFCEGRHRDRWRFPPPELGTKRGQEARAHRNPNPGSR